MPPHFLALKAALLREASERGGVLPRDMARAMFRLEPARTLRVYDTLAAAGWIQRGDGLQTRASGPVPRKASVPEGPDPGLQRSADPPHGTGISATSTVGLVTAFAPAR